MTKPVATVDILIPCRNEAGRIAACLQSIWKSDYPADRFRVIVADGMSDDGTRETLARLQADRPELLVVDNPNRFVSSGLNAALAESTADVIVRMDVHAEYPSDYLPKLVRWLETSGADNVGGLCNTRPASGTPAARAIAAAMSHLAGVGMSRFRTGTREPAWVDTVPFGCWRRQVFDRIGRFDEELIRNQDDEFNSRLIKAGGHVLLVPDVISTYYARDTLPQLWRMSFQYGFYKPLVALKTGRLATWRQLAPPALVATLTTLIAAAPWWRTAAWSLAGIIAGYVTALLGASIHAAATRRTGFLAMVLLPLTFLILHAGYGVGYWLGLAWCLFVRRPNPKTLARSVSPP